MKIYILETDGQNYGYFDYATDTDEDCGISADYDSFKGESIKDKWTTPRLIKSKLIPKKKREKMQFGDILGSSGIPILSHRAMECLWNMIKDYGEFLPAETDAGDYYFYNCLNVVDVLDYERTVFKYWEKPPIEIQNINTYSFQFEKVRDLIIFKIPTLNYGELYVTDKFKVRVEECELRGFVFKEVWESEDK